MPYQYEEASLKTKNARELFVLRAEKAGELNEIFTKSKDANSNYDLTGAQLDEVRSRNEELDLIGKQFDAKNDIETKARHVAALAAGKEPFDASVPVPTVTEKHADGIRGKSLYRSFKESKAAKRKHQEIEIPDFEVKTLFETGAGYAPETTRTGTVIMAAQRQPTLLDVLPTAPTDQVAYVYMEETTFTNNAAEVAEGGTYGEAALVLTEQTSPVRKIAVWLPVTDEQLDDVAGVQPYIENRLTLMLRQRLEGQVIAGDGTAPNISGLLDISGTQTQALGADPVPDAFYKAMTKVMVTGRAEANVVLMHPNDWQALRLLRTADGIYIWGSPSDSAPARLWGLPVRASTAVTENTGIVLDTSFFLLFTKAGISFNVSDSHSDYFVKGKQAIRAQLRAGLAAFRPAALCTVTGI